MTYLGHFFLLAKFIESSLKVNVFILYCYISYLFSYHIYISPTLTFEFFQHMNNNNSDLINHSAPKPLLSTNLAIDAVESTKNYYQFTYHSTYMMQWWVFFKYCNHIMKPMFSLRHYIGIQVQLPFSFFSRTSWSSFFINLVIGFHSE
jgi:hypothetical protein